MGKRSNSTRMPKSKMMLQSILRGECRLQEDIYYSRYLHVQKRVYVDILMGISKDLLRMEVVKENRKPTTDILAATLRYLTTGVTLKSLAITFDMRLHFLDEVIPICCALIVNLLKKNCFTKPLKWRKHERGFSQRFHMPMCLGALGKRRISYRGKANEDPACYNSSDGSYSMMLLGISDSKYRFLTASIGSRKSLGGKDLLESTHIGAFLRKPHKYFPDSREVGNNRVLSYFLIAAGDFTLQDHLMTPYPCAITEDEENFNFRLLNAMQANEHAFEMLFKRFRVLQKPMEFRVPCIQFIVQACIVLHNLGMVDDSIPPIKPYQRHNGYQASLETERNASQRSKWLRHQLALMLNDELLTIPLRYCDH